MLREKLFGKVGARGLALCAGLFVAIFVLAHDRVRAQQPKPAAPQTPPKALTNLNNQLAGGAVAPAPTQRGGYYIDPVVIPACALEVIQKEEVPSQRDGVILFIGTHIKEGETVPPGRHIKVKFGGSPEELSFRELKEGDWVEAGQLMAQLDDRLARDDVATAQAKVSAAAADYVASEKTRDETAARLDTAKRLSTGSGLAISQEEFRERKLTHEKYIQEVISKGEAKVLAQRENNKALTTLGMYEIRSAIPGVIKMIYKHKGEAIKALEPVITIQNPDRLRVVGTMEVQYRGFLEKGMQVVVEPSKLESPAKTFLGHLQEITGVAVSKDTKNPLIVSSSKDGTVRIWSVAGRYARRQLRHDSAVFCVACTSPKAEANLFISGTEDGTARIYDLDKETDKPVHELKNGHRGRINCVAFSQDGLLCVTGGEDRNICVWDTTRGQLKYRVPQNSSHKVAIISLSFTPDGQLVSAGRDGALRIWNIKADSAELAGQPLEGRSNNVSQLGISSDGKTMLFDKDRELMLMSVATGNTIGAIQNAYAFTTFALISPDNQLALTAGGREGRLQLWRMPSEQSRGYELRQWVPHDSSAPTCAAFAADGSFAVTATKDHQIYVWSTPPKEETDQILTAEITYIDQEVEKNGRQVRVAAELANPGRRLLPGTTVTLVAYPRK